MFAVEHVKEPSDLTLSFTYFVGLPVARGRENLVSCSQDGRRLRRSRDRVQGDDGGVVDDVCRVSSSTSDDVEVDDQQQTSGSAAPVKVEATAEPQPGPSRSSPQPGPSGT